MILLNGLHAVRTASLFGLMNSCQGFVLAGAGRSITARGRQIGSSRSVSTFGNNRPLVVDSGRPDVCSIPGDREFNGGVLSMSVRDMIGADVETGGLFDPLGFSNDEPSLFRRRAVELKHGRVAMVAMVGILAQSFVRFPGFPPFPVSNPARPLAVFERMCAAEGNAVILTLLCIGVVELTIGRQDYVDRAPGELGEFGALAKPVDEEEWEKVQMAELKHGRLAMLAAVGCIAQEVVTGEGPVEQLFTGNVRGFDTV